MIFDYCLLQNHLGICLIKNDKKLKGYLNAGITKVPLKSSKYIGENQLSKVDLKESESIINFYEKNLAIWSNEISNRYLNLIK